MLIWPLSFLSSGCSTARTPRTCGTTMRVCTTRSRRARGEQGDPLMPALYALGQHAALAHVDASLHKGRCSLRSLTTSTSSVIPPALVEIFLQVKQSLARFAGVQVNLGKTKVWNRAATRPEDLHTIGAEAWRGEGPEEEQGLVVLGVPVGHSAFVQKWLADKEESHQQFLTRIPAVQDAQCAWLLLLMCAGPRANHILRNLPPSEVSQFAQNHDTSLRACLAEILAVPVPTGVVAEVAHLPFREGGLGLRSAMRLSPAAYWASWANCLSQVHARAPQVCTQFLQELEGLPSRAQCVREAQDAAALLAAEGMEVPDWSRFTVPEFRAPQPVNPDVGEWIHGWQFHASVARDTLSATRVHLPPLSTDHQALRASQRGPCASRHFICLPTSQETTFTSEEFRTLLLVRLHLPLHVDERVCKCGQPVDVFGHHWSACSWRESAEKQALVSRRINFYVISMSSFLRATSAGSRSLRTAFHFLGGKQVAIDTTVVSALTGRGMARGRRQGQAIHEAEQDKCRRYHELVKGSRCHLLVMAFEVAGRWSATAVTFLQNLAWFKSLSVQVFCAVPRSSSFSSVGLLCWLAPSNGHMRRPSWANHWERLVA